MIRTLHYFCRSGFLVILLIFLFFADPVCAEEFMARGMVVSPQRTIISSGISSTVRQLPFRVGEKFATGDLLVDLDDQLLIAQKNKIAAELRGARMKLENSRELEHLSSIGAFEVVQAGVDVERLQAEADIARLTLERCQIKAPFNGRVAELFVNEHQSVSMQEKLLEIVGIENVELEVMIPSVWLSWIRPGTAFTVRFDATAKQFNGHVKVLGAIVDPVSKMIKLRGALDSPGADLIPGMTAETSFLQ